MKKAIVLFLAVVLCEASIAQDNTPASFPSPMPAFLAPEEIVQQIMGITALNTGFEIRTGKVKNIEASISRRKRIITYNPEYIEALATASGSKWAVIALFAHEIGHHLNGHTLGRGGSQPQLELEADEFAGYILGRLGATLDQSTLVMNYIAGTSGSKTHPARADRMHAIEQGWKRGKPVN